MFWMGLFISPFSLCSLTAFPKTVSLLLWQTQKTHSPSEKCWQFHQYKVTPIKSVHKLNFIHLYCIGIADNSLKIALISVLLLAESKDPDTRQTKDIKIIVATKADCCVTSIAHVSAKRCPWTHRTVYSQRPTNMNILGHMLAYNIK